MSTKAKDSEEPYVMVLDKYYPASLVSSIVNIFNNPFDANEVNNFSFHAYRKSPLDKKLVYIFIIGESSSYYHWQINGYQRPTSPKIVNLKNLISFSNVVSGAHYTELSVP
ncbi:MAG: sulfatase-like hydrolase/transferase, partial [Chitinophagaceae bacterium]